MNKLLIGLLIIAVAAGAFFYLRKKESATDTVKKEWIVGNWKLESLKSPDDSTTSIMVGIMSLVDSNMFRYKYEFTKEQTILRSLGDSVTADTSRYEWTNKNQLVWKEDKTDSTGSILHVAKLNKDSLLLESKDSIIILFTKLK